MNDDLIRYRREKSKETLEDAYILFGQPAVLSLESDILCPVL
jgi:hypothetical protein